MIKVMTVKYNKLPVALKNYDKLCDMINHTHRIIGQFKIQERFMSLFKVSEALYSTRIEGTQTTIESFYEESINEIKNVNNRELKNYIESLDLCKSLLKSLPISTRLFKKVHESLLTGDVRGKDCTPGEYRKTQNWIGPDKDIKHATFIPPSPDKINEYLSNLEKYINDDSVVTDNYDELVKCAIIHAQFETIHPFLDGNGRVGRILIPAYIYSKNITKNMDLYISPTLEAKKHKYYDLLNETRKGNWDGWIEYFLDCIINQTVKNIDRIDEFEALLNKGARIVTKKYSSDTYLIYSTFFRKPVCTLNDICKLTNFNYDKVRRAVQKLVKEKLIYKDDKLRNSKYYCYDVIDIIKKI